jgi:hypothetical protein
VTPSLQKLSIFEGSALYESTDRNQAHPKKNCRLGCLWMTKGKAKWDTKDYFFIAITYYLGCNGMYPMTSLFPDFTLKSASCDVSSIEESTLRGARKA